MAGRSISFHMPFYTYRTHIHMPSWVRVRILLFPGLVFPQVPTTWHAPYILSSLIVKLTPPMFSGCCA
jgi:hypothetical protein